MNEFYDKGYKVIRNLIDKDTIKKLQLHCQKAYRDGEGNVDDKQASGSPSFYNDELMEKLQKKILLNVEKHSGLKLFKTYTYWRMYRRGTILKAHTDRPACEVSITLQIEGKSWPLFIMNRDEQPIQVQLHDGDALLYRGCELLHWRPKFNGDEHAQVFLHYVDQFGTCRDHKDDQVNRR